MLPLVLGHHADDVGIPEQWRARVEPGVVENAQRCRPYARQLGALTVERGKWQRPACCARMLERVVCARHFREANGPRHVLVQPQLLERRNVAEVPEDGAHEGVVLRGHVLIGERCNDRECVLARTRERCLCVGHA